MQKANEHVSYLSTLRQGFGFYRMQRFAGRDDHFEPRPIGEAVVLKPEHAAENILVWPELDADQRHVLLSSVPVEERHRWFRSLQSSQAIVQSVFGTVLAMRCLPSLAGITSDEGLPAFGPIPRDSRLTLEKAISSLGEPRPTSVDAWIEGPYRVAIECKLTETEFGTCSRPRLTPRDNAFEAQHCDGSHTRQRGRTARCPLTAIGVRYWDHMEGLFGWSPESDHRPCPLNRLYQVARNIMAATVQEGRIDTTSGHALIVYDERNPAFRKNGEGDLQFNAAKEALRKPDVLRRISWQRLMKQLPDGMHWLKNEVRLKYGIE